MNRDISIVFLGVNDAGMRVYEWLCERDGISVHSLLTTKEQLSVIESVEPDYVISCGYRHIVPESILSVPSEGCLNLHAAYLPYNRGANPNVWSIVDETPAGITLHYMDSGIDTGPIVARWEVETDFADTGRDLYRRLEDAQVELFRETWPAVEDGTASAGPQDSNTGTYHETADFRDLCKIDPDAKTTPKALLNRLRALTFPPHENAIIEVDGRQYHVEVNIEPVNGGVSGE